MVSVDAKMTLALACAILAGAAAATALLTGRLLPYLERASMLDLPNARSLHNEPVPRGGGVAIAAVVLLTQAVVIGIDRGSSMSIGMAWWMGGLGFALLGWWDDRRSRSNASRFLLQLGIAGGFVSTAVLTSVTHGVTLATLLLIGAATVLVVWIVNLFNFMDGADGFAGTQALLYAIAAVALLLYSGGVNDAFVAAAIAGAALGFLYWNRAPARVFMGDAGSYFLGFQLAALAIAGVRHGQSMSLWIILLAPFLADATLTLVRRVVSGDQWWSAHRTHAFQLLITNGWSPDRLMWSLVALNVFVCWPLAAWAVLRNGMATIAALLALILAGMIWFVINRDQSVQTTSR